jgi:hypothetical protein
VAVAVAVVLLVIMGRKGLTAATAAAAAQESMLAVVELTEQDFRGMALLAAPELKRAADRVVVPAHIPLKAGMVVAGGPQGAVLLRQGRAALLVIARQGQVLILHGSQQGRAMEQ